MEHDFRDSTSGVELSSGVSDGTVWKNIDDARHIVVDSSPVVHVHAVTSSGMSDGWCVQEEVGGPTASGVDDHGVFECSVGEDVFGLNTAVFGHDKGAGRSYGDVEPCGCAAGRERGVSDGESERFGDDLRCSGGTEELASTAWGCACAASDVLGVFEGDFTLCEPGTDGLDHSGVFTGFGSEGNAAGNDDDGFVAESGDSHHHCGQAFVAGCDAHYTASGW